MRPPFLSTAVSRVLPFALQFTHTLPSFTPFFFIYALVLYCPVHHHRASSFIIGATLPPVTPSRKNHDRAAFYFSDHRTPPHRNTPLRCSLFICAPQQLQRWWRRWWWCVFLCGTNNARTTSPPRYTTRYHPPNRLQMNETYQHPGSWEDTILVPTLTRSDPTHFIMSHVIRGLSPNSVYEVMIQARNVHGWNEVSCASLGSVCSRFCVNVKCVTSFLRVDPFGCLAAFWKPLQNGTARCGRARVRWVYVHTAHCDGTSWRARRLLASFLLWGGAVFFTQCCLLPAGKASPESRFCDLRLGPESLILPVLVLMNCFITRIVMVWQGELHLHVLFLCAQHKRDMCHTCLAIIFVFMHCVTGSVSETLCGGDINTITGDLTHTKDRKAGASLTRARRRRPSWTIWLN